jgi:ATP-dependent exoDNAse (exonuclease V) beta subunit
MTRSLASHRPPPEAFAHTAILASAGSGKTYQLTSRYLRLLAAGADPAGMLTSTFTRLAAGEIRDRILRRLADAANNAAARSQLAATIHSPGIDDVTPAPPLDRATVIGWLTVVARGMHVLQVRTLDSFFASIVRTFAIELGLPPEPRVIEEDLAAALRGEAIALMLDERDPQALIDLLRRLTQDAADRSVTETIDRAVSGLHALWRETEPGAWECVPEREGLLPPPQLAAAIARLDRTTVRGDRMTTAHVKSCEAARAHRWESFLDAGIANSIAENRQKYGSSIIAPDVRRAYEPLVHHAIAEMVRRARAQTLATRDLLAAYHAQLERLKRRDGVVMFDDLAEAAARAAGADDETIRDDITFRIDARIRHLLLDEFQDTSLDQWRALQPLAREIVSTLPPDRTFFCVGDVKQSIYAWRNAAPEVLDELPRLLPGPGGTSAIRIDTMNTSRRSAQPVIDAVNDVFDGIVSNAALADNSDAAEAWRRGFHRHGTVLKDEPGFVELRTCAAGTSAPARRRARLAVAAERAVSLHAENPTIRIAILVRTNASVAELLFRLRSDPRHVPVSGRGGGPLTDAAPVNAVLDLLHLADHPADTIAAYHIACSPLGEAVELHDWRAEAERQRVARLFRRRLLEDGYAATIADLVPPLAPRCDRRELRRLLQLVELAAVFDPRRTLRTRDFIAMAESTAVADPQPSAIHVMTIHQSKGMEFDAVILPELEWSLARTDTRRPWLILERDGETGPIRRVCRAVNSSVRRFLPNLAPMFARHERRLVRESLSLLYVAMTRARHALYMVVDAPPVTTKGEPDRQGLKTAAGVLRSAVAPGVLQPETTVYHRGDLSWFRRVQGELQPAPEALPIEPIRLARTGPASPRGTRAASASQLASAAAQPLLRHASDEHEARDRGIAMHALFERLDWIESFAATDEELRAVARRAAPRRDAPWIEGLVRSFHEALARPAVAAILSRHQPARGRATPTLRRELPFARLVDGAIQSGAIDRLILWSLDGRIVDAEIIDLKTDAVTPDDAAAHAERYRPQLSIYRDVVSTLPGVAPDRMSVRVVFLATGQVIDLS